MSARSKIIAAGGIATGLSLILILILSLRSGPRPQTTHVASDPGGLHSRFILGAYGAPVVPDPQKPSRIDIGATIDELTTAGVNTYAYLVGPAQPHDPDASLTQWEQLPAFAAQAARAGIAVYVYLVPPTESDQSTYRPFGWNYTGWARAVGDLARRYPAIKGIMLDDFGGNVRPRPGKSFYFTPAYIQRMVAVAREGAPWLAFLPILYYHDLVGVSAILPAFRPYFDGVVFPYFGYSDGHSVPGNTVDPTRALAQGADVGSLLNCDGSRRGCLQLDVTGTGSPNSDGYVARVSRQLTPIADRPASVSIRLRDDSGAGRGTATVLASVNGAIVGSGRSHGDDWAHIKINLSSVTAGESKIDFELKVILSGSPVHSVLISGIKLSGFSRAPDLTRDLETSGGVDVQHVRSIPMIFMTYTTPLSAEKGRGASPSYVRRVLAAAEQLRTQDLIGGSLVFQLPLPGSFHAGDPQNYTIVRDLYRRWR